MFHFFSGKRKADSILLCTGHLGIFPSLWPQSVLGAAQWASFKSMIASCYWDSVSSPSVPESQHCCAGDQRLVSVSSGAVGLCPQPKPSTGGVWLVRTQKQWLGCGT